MREIEQVLEWLRALAWPCAPPIGVGEFEILYANAVEVVVWYSPAREGHRAGEVTIPCARLAAAWEALRGGAVLDEPTLIELCGNAATGRWVLALLALLPGTHVLPDPLALTWAALTAAEPAPAPPFDGPSMLPPDGPPAVEAAPVAAPRRGARPRRRRATS